MISSTGQYQGEGNVHEPLFDAGSWNTFCDQLRQLVQHCG